MRHRATAETKEKLIKEANQAKAELMASADGVYPQVNLHDVRHITEKGHPLYGREILDPVPFSPPVPLKRPTNMLALMQEQIKIAKLQALNEPLDTLEEADDFDIPDDPPDPTTRWENDYEPSVKEIVQNRAQIEAQLKALEAAEAASKKDLAPQGHTANAQPGATPPQRSGGGEDIAQPGEPPLTSSQKANFFGRRP